MEQERAETIGDVEYRYRVERGCVTVTRCVAHGARVSVPARLDGFPVIALGDESFASSQRDALSLAVVNAQLERVDLPDGLVRIGRAAFRGCSRLARVTLPATLERIDDLAFSCTLVSVVRLPQTCVRLTDLALRTGPESLAGAGSPYLSKLNRIEVAKGNPVFCAKGGVLCRKLEGGSFEAVLCPGKADEVVLDESVVRITPATFAGTYEIGRLCFHENIELEGSCGIAPNAFCAEVEVTCGRTGACQSPVKLAMPSRETQRGILSSTKGMDSLDLAAFLARYDEAVLQESDRLLQSKLMIARLARPICLGDEARMRFQATVERDFETIVIQYGARNYWKGFDDMADAGVLDEGAITRAIGVLTAREDAMAVARLLELKRARFDGGGWDYGL